MGAGATWQAEELLISNERRGLRATGHSDFHALGGRAHTGVVVARVLYDFVDERIVVVRIVVEKNEFLGTAFHYDFDRLAPVTMAPTPPAGLVFFGKILRVVNQHVGAFGKFADILVELLIARLVVGGVDQDAFPGLKPKAHASLWMVQPHGPHGGVIVQLRLAFLDVVEIPLRLHLAGVHREVRRGHLLFHHALQAAGPAGGVKGEAILGIFIERAEEGDALDVVPVKVRNEDVGRDGLAVGLAFQLLAEATEAGTAVENIKILAEADFHAGSVSSVAQVPGLRGGRRSAHSPELDPHTPSFHKLWAERSSSDAGCPPSIVSLVPMVTVVYGLKCGPT